MNDQVDRPGAEAGRVGSGDRVRVALVGSGRIGAVHAAALDADPRAELAVVCSPTPDHARRLAEPRGARWCTGVDEALQGVDAVVIASPTPLHVDHLLAAVAAGPRVLCEKPLALDLDQAQRCVAELGSAADRVMLGFNRRFDPTFAEIHRRVGEGEIGTLRQLVIVSRDPAPPGAAYLAESGGLFKDMTIHDLDMARHFLGDIVEVSACGTAGDEDVARLGDVDQAVVTLRSNDGALATIVNSRTCPFGYDQRLEAFGSEGMLSADNLTATAVRTATRHCTDARSTVLDFFLERYEQAYRNEMRAFIDAVVAGEAASPSVRDGWEALLLAAAAKVSLDEHRALEPTAVL